MDCVKHKITLAVGGLGRQKTNTDILWIRKTHNNTENWWIGKTQNTTESWWIRHTQSNTDSWWMGTRKIRLTLTVCGLGRHKMTM